MRILVIILSIIVFIKTTSYGIYEIKNNQNKPGGITVIVIATVALIFPNLMICIRGI